MKKLGLVGWRGMVGSVLLERMRQEGDFKDLETTFYSTSQKGQDAPQEATVRELQDAYDLENLSSQDIIITCQGGDYTKKVYQDLRTKGWKGYWIDAASALRMSDEAVIILDPVNRDVIDKSLKNGGNTFVGGNCTVSLMLMALGGLFKEGLVEWVTSMTYQAASGAGAQNMKELVCQMKDLGNSAGDLLDPAADIIKLDTLITERMNAGDFPTERFGHALAGSVLPWIDTEVENGQSREEWKGMSETNKILATSQAIPVDGTCVRMGAMRCHSQAFTIKLKKDLPIEEIEKLMASANDWVELIPNKKEETLAKLTPASTSGKLRIPVGRVRKMNLGGQYLNAFTCGDQLLWGAAEPLRRMLNILLERL